MTTVGSLAVRPEVRDDLEPGRYDFAAQKRFGVSNMITQGTIQTFGPDGRPSDSQGEEDNR